jgi:hypothetical protein
MLMQIDFPVRIQRLKRHSGQQARLNLIKKGRALRALPALFYNLQNSVLLAFLVHLSM